LADQPAESLTSEQDEKTHYSNCKQIAKEFQILNSTLEALGGSSYLVACIPHPKVPDLDQSAGAAGLAVATTLDGWGINLRTLLASEHTKVNIENNRGMTASVMSRAVSSDLRETLEQKHQSTGSERRSELQAKVRERLRKLLDAIGKKSGVNGQLPHGIWNKYRVVNWPTDAPPVHKLNGLSVLHCEKVVRVLDTLALEELSTRVQTTHPVFRQTMSSRRGPRRKQVSPVQTTRPVLRQTISSRRGPRRKQVSPVPKGKPGRMVFDCVLIK